MKQITLIIIILLLAISSGFADGYPAEEAEHWEKVRQLEQLADRFKAETGFTGSIESSTERMRLSFFEGRFSGIQITADADTATFRAAFEQILDKVLPYTFAKREQLIRSGIRNNLGRIKTEYFQQVNGFRVEGAGKISIVYETGRNGFAIGNGTVVLPETDDLPTLSYEDAVQIAKGYYVEELGYSEDVMITPKTHSITFVGINGHYELCYVLGIPDPSRSNHEDYTIVINAITGLVKRLWNESRPVIFHVTGEVFPENESSYSVPTTISLGSVEIQNGNEYYYSADDGNCTFDSLPNEGISSRLKLNSMYFLTVHPDDTFIRAADSITPIDEDNISIQYDSDAVKSANIYYHIIKQHIGMNRLFDYIPQNLQIITGADISSSGLCNATQSWIKIRADKGQYSHVVRHELSHLFMHKILSNNWLGGVQYDNLQAAMDEAIAHYLPCSMCDSPQCSQGLPPVQSSFEDLSNITAAEVTRICYSICTLNEDVYSYYHLGLALASAWWGLRSRPDLFPPDAQGRNGVDTLLVNSLDYVGEKIPDNDAYRYKPRYFYNILMSRVAANNISWPLNDKQVAIDSVYSVRGFHFYPRVQSVASANCSNPVERETYNVLDSVYVHISNCPQNTDVTVFVVQDMGYDSVGIGGIAIPTPIEVNGNSVSISVCTDPNGEWAGPIPCSNELPQGDYDIIVDVGGPSAPDNMLNLVFAQDNIIDGVDGLDGAGFTKTGFGDMVVALDLSSSMQGYSTQLGNMVEALAESMIPSERINVFGFTEGTASENWLENGITNLIGDEYNFFGTSQISQASISSIDNTAAIDGNTDLVLPFYHGDRRLNNLGDSSNKNIIILSDGIHFVTPQNPDCAEYLGNWTHTIGFIDTLITTEVVPDSIRCFTICYGDDQNGEDNILS